MNLHNLKIILKEIRVTHWLKNLVIFMPPFFGHDIFARELDQPLFLVFIAFCFAASAVYVFNDLIDIDLDRQHQQKKYQPLAAGEITKQQAYILIAILVGLSLAAIALLGRGDVLLIIGLYVLVNLLYTLKFKHLPMLDIFFVAGMYLIRLYTGSVASGIFVSGWLFVTVFFGSMLVITGKRYTEIKGSKIRPVLKLYTPQLLSSLLLITTAITTTAFTVYAINLGVRYIPAIVIFTFAIFRYFYLIETTSLGEKPESLFLQDKQILLAIIALLAYNGYLVYYY